MSGPEPLEIVHHARPWNKNLSFILSFWQRQRHGKVSACLSKPSGYSWEILSHRSGSCAVISVGLQGIKVGAGKGWERRDDDDDFWEEGI